MATVKASLYLIVIVFLMNSCVMLVEDELEGMPQEVVLNSILLPERAVSVHLSLTSSFTEAAFSGINNAEVTIYENGELFEVLTLQSDGLYVGTQLTQAGAHYQCVVQIPDYGQVMAEDIIPHPIHFANEYTDYGIANEEGVAQPRVNLDILHDSNIDYYFDLGIYLYDENNGLRNAQTVLPYDKVILEEGLEIPLFTNKLMSESPYFFQTHLFVNSFGCSDLGCSATIFPTILELRTISYSLYRYLQNANTQEQARIPEFGLSMPPAINSYSNVENGRGIFAAYSFVRSDTIPPPPRPY